jgi:hypothetical protein
MAINEKDRLDLRQELERLFSDPRLATIAMEAMPPIDYSQLATKSDLAALDAKFDAVDAKFDAVDGRFDALQGRFTAIDGKFVAIDGKIDRVHGALEQTMAAQLRMIVLMQIATIAAVVGIIQANV